MAIDNDPPVARPTSTLTIPELLGRLATDLSDLFRKETQLLRSEVSDKVTQLEIGLGSLAAGAVVLLVALNVLAGALVAAVAKIGDMGAGWAALIVGVIFAGIGIFLVWKGASDMKPANLSPDRSAHQLKQDARLAKDQVT